MARKPSSPSGNAPIILTFAGGVNALRREADVDINECTTGGNFDLKSQQLALSPRKSLEVVGIVPGGKAIRGYGQLVKTDGTISTLIQSGGDVYSWDGTSTGFTLVGTVDTGTKLRSSRDSNVTDEDIVILTDLAKLTPVKQWNGVTFQSFTHNLSDPLYAKYCKVFNERAYFANLKSGTDTPHVILASTGGDVHTLTVTNRPASAINAEDPWFLPIPDLRPINGLEFAYGTTIVATVGGRIYQLIEEALQAATATISEKRLDEFYAGSSLAGDEAMVQIGNDVMLGLKGRIELLSGVQQFGDVQADDASLHITPLIEETTSWTLAYDRQQQLVYCLPSQSDSIWVYYKNVAFSNLQEIRDLSPWSEFTTDAPLDMTNSTLMPIVDPVTKEETVFLGSQDGRIYAFAGERGSDVNQIFPVKFLANQPAGRLLRSSALSGAADGKAGFFSGWISSLNTSGTTAFINGTKSGGGQIAVFPSYAVPEVGVIAKNSAGVTILDARTTVGGAMADGDFHHFVAAWDLANGLFEAYIDDIDAVPTINTLTNDTIPYSTFDNWVVHTNLVGFDTCYAEIYFNSASYIDLTSESNRRLLISDGFTAANLSIDGSAPTGASPIVYLRNDPQRFHINRGTGGDFASPSPALQSCSLGLAGGGGEPIITNRTTKLFVPVPVDDEMFDIRGWISYKKSGAFNVTMKFLFGGFEEADQSLTISIPATNAGGFYHGPYYYGNGTPYSNKRKSKIFRQNFGPVAGRGQNFQLEVAVSATTDFEISEIGLLFDSSTR